MVQSSAATVDDYLLTVDPARLEALRHLRAACLASLPGWDEKMQWGMPGYAPPGLDAVVSFNSQKRHIAFYAGPTAVERFKDRLAGIDCGKGCVRYSWTELMDFDVISDMLRDIHSRAETMC